MEKQNQRKKKKQNYKIENVKILASILNLSFHSIFIYTY